MPLHRYNLPLYGAVLHNLGCPRNIRSGAEQGTLIAQPHLAQDVLGEHAGLIQPSPSRQNTARQGRRGGVAGRAIREFGTGPRCAFWLMRGGSVGGRCALLFSIQTALGAGSGQGVGSCPMLSQELRAVSSQMGDLIHFLPQEPGRVWLGLLWPNREVGFRSQHVTFWSSPHLSPGAYKRRSVEPFALCFALFFSAPLGSALAAAHCLCPSLPLHLWLVYD